MMTYDSVYAKIKRRCAVNGFDYRGTLAVVTQANYVATFPVPDVAASEKIIAAAKPILEECVDCIRQEISFQNGKTSALDRLKAASFRCSISSALRQPLFIRTVTSRWV